MRCGIVALWRVLCDCVRVIAYSLLIVRFIYCFCVFGASSALLQRSNKACRKVNKIVVDIYNVHLCAAPIRMNTRSAEVAKFNFAIITKSTTHDIYGFYFCLVFSSINQYALFFTRFPYTKKNISIKARLQ